LTAEVRMSRSAAHESKRSRQTCQRCRDRKAWFRFQGSVRANRDHTLCFECYRSQVNHERAERLGARQPEPPAPRSPFKPGELSSREVLHRERMLSHLARVATV